MKDINTSADTKLFTVCSSTAEIYKKRMHQQEISNMHLKFGFQVYKNLLQPYKDKYVLQITSIKK